MHDRKVVLVVDDDGDARDLLAELIRMQGLAVIPACDGLVGLAALRAAVVKPCLIFIDIQMPHADGYDFRREQRADPALASIPTVVITAMFDRCDRARLGDAEVLRKPFPLPRVVELLRLHGGPLGAAR